MTVKLTDQERKDARQAVRDAVKGTIERWSALRELEGLLNDDDADYADAIDFLSVGVDTAEQLTDDLCDKAIEDMGAGGVKDEIEPDDIKSSDYPGKVFRKTEEQS